MPTYPNLSTRPPLPAGFSTASSGSGGGGLNVFDFLNPAGSFISAFGNLFGAISQNRSRNRLLDAEYQRTQAFAKELDRIFADLAGQRENRAMPTEIFADFIRDFPGLYKNLAYGVAPVAQDIAKRFTRQNVSLFNETQDAIDPEARGLRDREAALIAEMDPENLGQDEILAITRKASPLLPVGTLDPETGAVKGATTNPVSLYRNLISGEYQRRRQEFIGAADTFVAQTRSVSDRLLERAGPYFLSATQQAVGAGTNLANVESSLSLRDIEGQQRIAEIMLSGTRPVIPNAQI